MACLSIARASEQTTESLWDAAARNGRQAQDALTRCDGLFRAWYAHKGAANCLLPQNLKSRQWTAENAAADLWPFFVLTAYVTDREALDSVVSQTLKDEIRLTTRLGRLPDALNIDDESFVLQEVSIPRILFGASEYVKDGLLPISELMGRTAWFHRAQELLSDIFAHAPVDTPFGKLPSGTAEVNGDLLQGLCRFYSATGDLRFKQWAERIGDAYFLHMLPKNNGLPCHAWDFGRGQPEQDVLSLCDHGNEIILGLSELVMLEHAYDPAKAEQYVPPMRRMLDQLLEHAVNEDGLWYRTITPSTCQVINKATPDTWGYALDAVYTFYLVTGEEKYRDAVHRALRGINAKPAYREWNGADAYADSIEGGIVLLNRIPDPEGFAWLEAVTPVFLAKQREDGIVEGWHGDGNYARTALMYAMMKTAGVRACPWRSDLQFGSVADGDALCIVLSAEKPWQGTLHLDYPRHRIHMGLMINYPRLNEFPEWYTVEPTRLYSVTVNGKEPPPMLGDELVRGLPVSCEASALRIIIRPMLGPPYGNRCIDVEVSPVHRGDGPMELPVGVHNRTGEQKRVMLSTSFGTIEPAEVDMPNEGTVSVMLKAVLTEDVEVRIEAAAPGSPTRHCIVRLVREPNLVGFLAFNGDEYANRRYQWCGRNPVEFALPAKQGQPHTLHLLWGAKNDQRSALVTVNGHDYPVTKGGYDGFEWVTLHIPAEQVPRDSVDVRISANARKGPAAFVSEAKVTSP